MPEVFVHPMDGEILRRFAEMNEGKERKPAAKKVYDYYLKKEVEYNPKVHEQGIVYIDKNKNITTGIFTRRPDENILVTTDDGSTHVAMHKNVVDAPYKFIYNNRIGYYIIEKANKDKEDLLLNVKGKGAYPYSITKYYNAEFQLDNFKIAREIPKIPNKFKGILKHTIGIEFEASEGYLPQEKCFQLGLIPLSDGSITSVEYASIVLDESSLGLLKKQVEELKKYTNYDKECSLHIHLGGFPVSAKSIFAVYKVCKALEPFLIYSLPKYTFRTNLYKRTGKDYCKLLPEINTFNDLYFWASDHEANYAGSLTQPHPSDVEKRGKWNIQSRYFWLNLVNMLFYNSCKTIEFRMLRPTYNFNKIVYWIYVFNAILLYAKKIANEHSLEEIEKMSLGYITLRDIFMEVYPEELASKMYVMSDIDTYITKNQTMIKDYIGYHTNFEDIMYTDNILE